MKTLTKVIATTVLTLSTIGVANAATHNLTGTKLCVAAASGSKLKLSREIKNSGLRKLLQPAVVPLLRMKPI